MQTIGERGTLDRAALLDLLAAEPPLVEGLTDIDEQVQPNGIDVRLQEVSLVASAGAIGAGQTRMLPSYVPIAFDYDNWIELEPGSYLVRFTEIVHLPKSVMALGRPRSTLARCGADLVTAVWDAGYSGRSEALLVVHNPHGLRLQQGARIMQLVFFTLATPVSEGYSGRYQGENV